MEIMKKLKLVYPYTIVFFFAGSCTITMVGDDPYVRFENGIITEINNCADIDSDSDWTFGDKQK